RSSFCGQLFLTAWLRPAKVAEQGGVGGEQQGATFAQELFIGLQAAHEAVELRVLAIGLSVNLRSGGIAFATEPLSLLLGIGQDDGALLVSLGPQLGRLFFALATVAFRFAFTLGLHPRKDAGLDFAWQVRTLDPHVDDLDAKLAGPLSGDGSNGVHDPFALGSDHAGECVAGHFTAQFGKNQVVEPGPSAGLIAHGLIELERISNPPPSDRISHESLFVLAQILRLWGIGGQHSPIEAGDRLNKWELHGQARLVDGAYIFAELGDDNLFALVYGEEGLRRQDDSDYEHDRNANFEELLGHRDYLVSGGAEGMLTGGVTTPPKGNSGNSLWLMSPSTMSLSISGKTLSTVSRWSRSRVTSFAFSYSASTLTKRADSPCASKTRFSLYPSASRRICWPAPRARGTRSAWEPRAWLMSFSRSSRARTTS